MRKFFIKLFSMVFLAILPLFIFEVYIIEMPPAYSDTFVASLNDKVLRLKNTNNQKIVFIGGSSLPFGLKSELIEEQLGCEVVNFGLYATLGTKVMIDLSREYINPDDIVIIAPEVYQQAYSLYFNPEVLLKAIEENYSIVGDLSIKEKMSLFFYSYKVGIEKITSANDSTVTLSEPYSRKAFNEYGDIKTIRPYNLMPLQYDPSTLIDINEQLVDNEFVEYVNDYIEECTKKRAIVYFGFSPVNSLAVNNDSLAYEEFMEKLSKEISCDILGNVSDFIYDSKYFYDTNFHLNDSGAILHTKNLIILLKEKFNIQTPTNITVPEVIDKPLEEVINGDNKHLDYFEYELLGTGYYIKQINEKYLNVTSIVIPSTYEGKQIIGINSQVLVNCHKLIEIHIPETIMFLGEESLGAKSLERIYLYHDLDSFNLFTSSNWFYDNQLIRIYVKEQYIRRFQSDYTWSKYTYYFKSF